MILIVFFHAERGVTLINQEIQGKKDEKNKQTLLKNEKYCLGYAAKSYLEQLTDLENRINDEIEERDRMKDLAYKVTPNLDSIRVSGGSVDNIKQSYIDSFIDLDNDIIMDIEKYISLKLEIRNKIRAVRNPKYFRILKLKYEKGKTIEEIAVAMDISYKWATKLHSQALEKFAYIYSDFLKDSIFLKDGIIVKRYS